MGRLIERPMSGSPPPPLVADGDDVGVLVIHGFTGCTAETRPLGEHLAARGHTVRVPLLPRHGTHERELTRGSYLEWLEAMRAVKRELEARCTRVFVAGMSLGGLVALRLAQEDSGALAGVLAFSPALRVRTKLLPLTVVARHLITYAPGPKHDDSVDPGTNDRNWCYPRTPIWGAAEVWRLQRLVHRELAHVRAPLLAVQGRHDTLLEPGAGQAVLTGVSSRDKELHWLEHSGHNVLLDGERQALYERASGWIEAHAKRR